MKRSYGGKGLALIECINPKIQKYRVRFDIQPLYEDDEQRGVSFMEVEFLHKPSLSEIKEAVIAGYNKAVDEQIVGGFIWKGMQVWLSSENQFNYKAAYDLAVQTNGANLPLTFKFGDTYNPTYYKFESLEDLGDFYISAMGYINKCLAEGWAKKDSINWEDYKID